MERTTNIDPSQARRLADIAGLPLEEGREGPAAELLAAWLADANELSRKMAAEQYMTVQPVTVFKHPESEEMSE